MEARPVTNNHIELCGVETRLRQLLDRFNMMVREGTLAGAASLLADIQAEARHAEWRINDLVK